MQPHISAQEQAELACLKSTLNKSLKLPFFKGLIATQLKLTNVVPTQILEEFVRETHFDQFAKIALLSRRRHSNQRDKAHRVDGIKPRKMDGNFGYLTHEVNDEKSWGCEFSGLSGDNHSWAQSTNFALGKEPIKSKNLKIFHKASCNKAITDSEYLLINNLAGFLNTTGQERDKKAGTLFLFTERLPCASCINVIKDFLQAHPNNNINIGYFFPSVPDRLKNRETKVSKTLKSLNPENRLIKYSWKYVESSCSSSTFKWKEIPSPKPLTIKGLFTRLFGWSAKVN